MWQLLEPKMVSAAPVKAQLPAQAPSAPARKDPPADPQSPSASEYSYFSGSEGAESEDAAAAPPPPATTPCARPLSTSSGTTSAAPTAPPQAAPAPPVMSLPPGPPPGPPSSTAPMEVDLGTQTTRPRARLLARSGRQRVVTIYYAQVRDSPLFDVNVLATRLGAWVHSVHATKLKMHKDVSTDDAFRVTRRALPEALRVYKNGFGIAVQLPLAQPAPRPRAFPPARAAARLPVLRAALAHLARERRQRTPSPSASRRPSGLARRSSRAAGSSARRSPHRRRRLRGARAARSRLLSTAAAQPRRRHLLRSAPAAVRRRASPRPPKTRRRPARVLALRVGRR